MATKDKFKEKQQGGGFSFEDMVQQAATVAAIEKQAEEKKTAAATEASAPAPAATPIASVETAVRYMRLPNPQIPLNEYNQVSTYCNQFDNMTRQDWVELAIVEKLSRDGLMPDEDFEKRRTEIRNRPRRGQRKGFRSNG